MTDALRPRPSAFYRWTVLVFVSLAMGGNYYIYDSINPLEGIFKEQLGFSATQFAWLNSSYSVAAVLTLLIGGIVIRLNMLKPNPDTDQVRASRELKIVGGRQQVPCDHFELLRSHAAGARYAAHAANACRADRDGSNRVPGDQRNNAVRSGSGR